MQENRQGCSRRNLVGGMVSLPIIASLGVGACSEAVEPGPEKWRPFLAVVAGTLVPATDTSAADSPQVGAHDTAIKAIGVGMDGASFAMIETLKVALDGAAGKPFETASAGTRHDALSKIDRAAFTAGGAPPADDLSIAWRKIKGLILMGYYRSEVGASEELAYELVPGRYDPDIPVKPDTRALSSDWFAVSFR